MSDRILKIGATRIVEDPSMSGVSNEQVRDLLKTSYPETAVATLIACFHSFQRLDIPQKQSCCSCGRSGR